MSGAVNPRYHLICIGAGGTGGYILKELSRYLGGTHKKIASLSIIDGDRVEEHNLSRQCFQREDIGVHKASILAEVLNDAFNLSWEVFPYYLETVNQLKEWVPLDENKSIPLLLGCVDNHGCRMILEEYFQSLDTCIYFDAANEIESGEVVFSYKFKGKQVSMLRSEIFPDIKKGDLRNVTQLSCEELNRIEPQHITVNMMAGLILLSAISSLLEKNEIRPGMTCFNAASMSMEYLPMAKKGVE